MRWSCPHLRLGGCRSTLHRVQQWSNGAREEFGWRLSQVTGNTNDKQFYSSEYTTDPTLRPKLTVIYSIGVAPRRRCWEFGESVNGGRERHLHGDGDGHSPTGNVDFTDGGALIGGCAGVLLGGVGNTKTAQCTTSALASGSHSIVAAYGGDASNATSSNAPLTQVVNTAGGSTSGAGQQWRGGQRLQ